MNKVSKSQFSNSLIWQALDMVFGKSFTVIISLIIARFLSQEHYGLMNIWAVFVSIGNVLVLGGFDTILVQSKDISDEDWHTVRTSCLIRAIVLTVIMQICAGWISKLYASELLEPLLRVCCLDFFLQANISISIASISRHMSYKRLFIADVASTIIGCSASLIFLFTNRHLWVLLSNTLFTHTLYCAILGYFEKSTFGYSFNVMSHKKLIGPAFKAMTNNSIDIISGSISNLVLGKKWSLTDAGYYNRADKVTQTVGLYTFNVISGVLLPTFSSYQDDHTELKRVFRQVFSLSCFIMFPLMAGLAVCAKPLVSFVLTDRWLPSVPIIVVLCIVYALNPIRQMCLMLNYSVGNFKTNTKIESTRLIMTASIAIFVLAYGRMEIVVFSVFSAIQFFVLAVLYVRSVSKSINYRCAEVLSDVVPSFILSCIAIIPAVFIGQTNCSSALKLILDIPSAVLLYIMLAKLTKNQSFTYLISSIKQIIAKRRH